MKRTGLILLAIMLLATGMMAGCGQSADQKEDMVVQIGHKNYTEQRLGGQMLAVIIEATTDYTTEVTEFGGTMVCFEALKNGDIDVYPEYTGSAYSAVLEQSETLSPQETYDYVKQAYEERYGITWLGDMGWNNTYVLSVTPDTAAELGVTTVSELIPYASEMLLGCDNEFLGRVDGLPGMKEAYGIEFKEVLPMDQGLTYAALRDGEIDVNVSYSTDGRIAKFNLVNLEDDLSFFPPYYLAPILSMEYKDAHPAVVAALALLDGQFSVADMQKYNLMIDEGGDAREVAIQALQDKGLID